MKIKLVLFIWAGLGIWSQAEAQGGKMPFTRSQLDQLSLYEDTLSLLGYLTVNDTMEENRFVATRMMIPTLVSALKVPNSFKYSFARVKTVSILYPPDSTFRIFTWQLFVNNEEYRYYGAIQMNSPELKLYPLVDRSFTLENPEQAVLGADNWYGALYYGIRKLSDADGGTYLLMGFDAYSFLKKRKVLDVLSFAGGKPVFGADLIPPTVTQAQPRKRLILEYGAEASVRLNWDESLGMIVFDHLIPYTSRSGLGDVLVPDGSYEALQPLPGGKLGYIPMLETEVQDQPLRPNPILEGSGKDILGQPRKKNR